MLLLDVGCVFTAFILSGVLGQMDICALRGSSVDLRCNNSAPSNRWYTVKKHHSAFVQENLAADERYQVTLDSQPTLTISKFKRSDAKLYCCRNNSENPDLCWKSSIRLSLGDLQVKVISVKQKDSIELMCKSSCQPTGGPAVYIWYKDGLVALENKSVWHADLGDKAATYSCSISGITAPKVSVSVGGRNASCLNVTYAKGDECGYQSGSAKGSCSITYPRVLEVRTQETVSEDHGATLHCSSDCDLRNTTYIWFLNHQPLEPSHATATLVKTMLESGTFSCTAKLGEFSIGSKEKWIHISNMHTTAAVTGGGAALLVTIPAIIFIWIRTKNSAAEAPNAKQLSSTHLYENIPAQPVEQDELYYSTVNFHPAAQPCQPREHEHAAYAAVSIRPYVHPSSPSHNWPTSNSSRAQDTVVHCGSHLS